MIKYDFNKSNGYISYSFNEDKDKNNDDNFYAGKHLKLKIIKDFNL